jgi:hypothetical protein
MEMSSMKSEISGSDSGNLASIDPTPVVGNYQATVDQETVDPLTSDPASVDPASVDPASVDSESRRFKCPKV